MGIDILGSLAKLSPSRSGTDLFNNPSSTFQHSAWPKTICVVANIYETSEYQFISSAYSCLPVIFFLPQMHIFPKALQCLAHMRFLIHYCINEHMNKLREVGLLTMLFIVCNIPLLIFILLTCYHEIV